ncbi:MAG TPA: metallophosphoesterase [Burkholderiaceae bacterium]|nr:metallophosphoesterase [Burkholderiaceae bacterium]
MRGRFAWLRWWAWLQLAALLLACWAVVVEPRWIAKREIDHQVPRWQGPQGLKVAVASDWHFTKRPLWRVMTIERARQIVDEINAARPDVILLPGDFIADGDYRPEIAATAEDEIAAVLGQLKAPLGVYAVLGNHDWWFDEEKFRTAFERQGIKVIENDAMPIPGTALWVVGIGDDFTGHSRPAVAVSKLPNGAQALVLMHDPASLKTLPTLQGLVVAGHTHGGQVALPFFGALIVPGAAPLAWAYGWVEHGDNRMYVTSGLGVSILPVRFNRRPEWVMVTVRSGAK